MKGKILKKILAATLVMTLVSGAVPIAPVADLFGGVAITANAEGTERVYRCFPATAGTTAGMVDNQPILINANEEYAKLVDGIKDEEANKWCVVEPNDTFSVPVYIEFNSEKAFIPTGYILTTGGDTENNSGRNPKSWVIKAKNEGDTEWTTLETVTNDNKLEAKNNTSYEFSFTNTNTNPYKYFRFEVSAVQNGGAFQLAEFEFKGHPAYLTNITYGSIQGLNYNYSVGTPIDSLSYTVNNEDGEIVSSDNYQVTFTKDANEVTGLSEAGIYTMTVTGKGIYSGSCCKDFNVTGVALNGSGTENNPYLISSSDDWDKFVRNVSEGISYNNQFIALNNDISGVTTTVGTEAKPFKGTFDGSHNGQTHKMTVNITDTRSQGTAPFREISSGAVIKNLTVEGTVTGTTHAAGLVGFSRNCSSEKPNTIENCIVNTAVTVKSGNGKHMGGVVGHGFTSYLKIKNTVFGGTMYNTDSYAGGLMGWCDGGCHLIIDNCLFNGRYTGTVSNGFHPIAVSYNANVITDVQGCYYYHTAAPTLTEEIHIPVTTGEKVYDFIPFGYTTETITISGVSCYKVTGAPQSVLTITNNEDWAAFAKSVSNGFTYKGVVINLNSNITVTDMADGTFKGTLNGRGHKITFNYTQNTEYDAALFRNIEDATIKYLEVDGTINTSEKFAAAIAAHASGTCNINNCISRVNIDSTTNGDGTHAGFVALSEGGATVNINNSLFAGTITGSATTKCAGFVGYVNSTLNVTNSLMAGTLDINVTNESATFSRINYSGSNSYYRTSYGKVQGEAVGNKTNEQLAQALGRMWTISNGEVVPNLGAWNDLEYATVSGIDALYACTGNEIAVNPVVTDVEGNVLTENVDYTATLKKNGVTVASVKDAGTYTYTFTPAANSSYTGTLTSAEFTVQVIDISTAAVTGVNAEYEYTDSDISITPVITAADGKVLTNGTEYTTELKKDGSVVNSVKELGSYTYTFTGVQAQGYTGTKTVNFTVKLDKPTGIEYTAYGSDTAILSWKRQEYVTGYEVQYSKDSTFPEGSPMVSVSRNTATLTNLETNSKYYVRVRTLNGNYSSEWSDTADFETTSKRWIGFNATSYSEHFPVSYYKYSITQQIYTAQEIGAAGMITSVDFMKTDNSNCEHNIDIYMVHTDKVSFSGSSDAVAVTEADKVFSGTVDFAANEWTTINFDKGFNYNGTQNVALVIDDNTGTPGNRNTFKAINILDNTSLYYYHDQNNYSPTDLSGVTFTKDHVKNAVCFDVKTAHTVSIAPNIQNGTASTTITEEVAGRKVTVSVNPAEGYYCNSVSVNNGAVAVTKNADKTYSFTMPDGDAVISAAFAQRFNVAVTWKDWNGNVLDTQQVGVEEVPSYGGEAPIRPADDYYSYTFKDWDKEAEAITENKPVEFTAVYDKQPFYKVLFTVCDGTYSDHRIPYYGTYNDANRNISQSVYPSSMLANMKDKDIYSLTYYMSGDGSKDIVVKGMKVYLLEVENDTLSDIIDVGNDANALKVFEGDYTLSKSGTMRIDFAMPYHYNGGNLLISVQNSISGEADTRRFYGTNTDNVSSFSSNAAEIKFLAKCSFGIVDESKYSVTLPEGMEFCDGFSTPAVAGSTVQFKVKEGYTASNIKANDTDLTPDENSIYTVIVTGNTEITADIVAYTPVVINSVDINGVATPTTVYAETFTGAGYAVPANPYLDGYTFSGWKVNDSEPIATAEDVQTAVYDLVKAGMAVTVAVVYTKKEATHTVSFTADSIGCTIKNADGNVINAGTSVNVSEQLYAIANMGSEEQVFSHWMIGDTIVGYEKTYAFRMPDKDITLSAVYTTQDHVKEKVGTGYIESVKRTAENKLSFVAILCVPDDCHMLKAGVVVQSTENLNGAELTTANAKIIDYSDTSSNHYSSFKYTWTMKTSNSTKKWTVRPYLEYTDKNGNTQVIYGNDVSYCVNDVNM